MSICATNVPSIDTRAMPLSSPRMPSQVTDVPVKVNVAVAPAVCDSSALPPLHANQPVSCVHPGLKLTDGSVSSNLCTAAAGGAFDTVTVTGDEVAVLPAPSRARAVSVWEALLLLVVSQGTE